ncbi:MAG: EF-P 5-aminopentanol modification-associated protein YfmH [Symbiobacteriia bacterium]
MAVLENAVLREALHSRRLDSGLSVYVLPKPGFARKYATFATHYGSVDSEFVVPGEPTPTRVPDGIAHFLEHKLFEEEKGNVFDDFAKLGATTNAYTDYTTTTYLFSCVDNFPEAFEVLLNFVQHPYFTDENVAKEKGIITQELLMYRDDPENRVRTGMMEALFSRHPIRVDIGGTPESVSRITKEELYRCYRTFYHPSNMALFVVGDVDPERVFDQVAANQAKKDYEAQAEIRRVFPAEPKEVGELAKRQQMAVAQPLYRLGFKDTRLGLWGRELAAQDAATRIALEALVGMGSSLFQSLYQEGLVDLGFDADYHGEKSLGYSTLGGETKDPERLNARLLAGIEKLRQSGLSADDFDRAHKKFHGDTLRLFNNFGGLAYFFNHWLFRGVTIFEYLDVVAGQKLETVNRRLREHLDPAYHAVSVVAPK